MGLRFQIPYVLVYTVSLDDWNWSLLSSFAQADARPQEYFDDENEKNSAALEKDLQTLTERQFLVHYAYTYIGDRSLPHNMSTDPNAFLTSHEDFVSVPEGDTTRLTNHVDNTILGYVHPSNLFSCPLVHSHQERFQPPLMVHQ